MVRKDLLGFWDLFYALPADEERRTFLYAGQFLRAQPDWEALATQWRSLSGLEPASANPDFVAFVRMALALPVIEEPLLEAVESFMKLYAAFLTDRRRRRAASSVDALNRNTFSNLWPIEDWIDQRPRTPTSSSSRPGTTRAS